MNEYVKRSHKDAWHRIRMGSVLATSAVSLDSYCVPALFIGLLLT